MAAMMVGDTFKLSFKVADGTGAPITKSEDQFCAVCHAADWWADKRSADDLSVAEPPRRWGTLTLIPRAMYSYGPATTWPANARRH